MKINDMSIRPLRSTPQLLIFMILLTGMLKSCNKGEYGVAREQDFNLNWKFKTGEIPGAYHTTYEDTSWPAVDLPHDWSIIDYPEQDSLHIGPFYKDLPGGADVGYLRDGTAWYRKMFTLTPDTKNHRVIIHFDGIQTQSEVWVNGIKAGEHVYGYSPFWMDITDHLSAPGKENVIAVKTMNPGENSRWFAGAGIYRNVKLSVVSEVSVLPWGIGITTPQVSPDTARVSIDLQIGNPGKQPAKILCKGIITGPDGNSLVIEPDELMVPSEGSGHEQLSAVIHVPQLWEPSNPALYELEVSLYNDGELIDQVNRKFGIRTIGYSANDGFLLNGKEILLKGGCMHHDNGLLGSAAFRDAEYRRVRLIKENGFNAIRTSHNPPSEAFLDACDELGMLVINEAFDHWIKPKRPNDYSNYFREWYKKDIQAMVQRDRNHPSVIMWSFGNEVKERADPEGVETGKKLVAAIREIDTTRPVTQAICGFWDNPGKQWDYSEGAFELLDIGGYNYQWENYESDHEKYPERIMYGSESVPQHAWKNWQMVLKHPYVIGDFVWTSMDYIGESGIGHTYFSHDGNPESNSLQPWPWYVAWCGDLDITGNKKPQSYYRDILWGVSNLSMAVQDPVPDQYTEMISFWGWHNESKIWNWPGQENAPMTIRVYTSYPAVRLELNDSVIGEKKVSPEDKFIAEFEVPYQPGTLKASGLRDGQPFESTTLKTTGPAEKVFVKSEASTIDASRSSLVFINVSTRDGNDMIVPGASVHLEAEVSGPAELLAAGNGAPEHQGSLTDNLFSLFKGSGQIILRSTGVPGDINLTVSSDGLTAASVVIRAE